MRTFHRIPLFSALNEIYPRVPLLGLPIQGIEINREIYKIRFNHKNKQDPYIKVKDDNKLNSNFALYTMTIYLTKT